MSSNFAYMASLFTPLGIFYMPQIYDMALKNPTASAGFEPATLGTKRQHATPTQPKLLLLLLLHTHTHTHTDRHTHTHTHIHTHTHTHSRSVGSRFATVRFTTIHFYEPCRVGPSTPDLWCITVATQASFLYLVRF